MSASVNYSNLEKVYNVMKIVQQLDVYSIGDASLIVLSDDGDEIAKVWFNFFDNGTWRVDWTNNE